jgi:predicted TIM-barrel fold metal-dependent hydrolase
MADKTENDPALKVSLGLLDANKAWVKVSQYRSSVAGYPYRDANWIVQTYVKHAPERCLWGSDWPVVDTRADLPGWIAAFRTILAGYSEAEAAAMAHGTAARVYGVALPEVSAATQAR